MGDIRLKIKEWRRRIPSFKCKPDCVACCTGTPSFTSWEFNRLIKYGIKSLPVAQEPCPFIKDNKCSIYEERPIICRIYGAAPGLEHGKCKEGILPSKPMNPKLSNEILNAWWDILDMEEGKCQKH